MATEAIRYVDPNAASGGNGTEQTLSGGTCAYQSINAWEAARQRDLTSGDEIETAICSSNLDAGGGSVDAVVVNISGWTTSSTDYIQIKANSSHGGKWNDNIYRNVSTDGSNANIRITEENVRVIGIQIWHNPSSQTANYGTLWFNGVAAATHDIRVSKCIIRGNPTFDDAYIICGYTDYSSSSRSGQCRIWNCIFYDFQNPSNAARAIWNYNGTNAIAHDIYNNTFQNNKEAINITSNPNLHQIINNLFKSNTTDIGASGVEAGSGYNATNNSTLTYTVSGGATNDRVSQTFSFVDEDNDDFHLQSDDGGARNFGLDDPSSGIYSDDVDGQTRVSTWDIGADEYVVSSAIGRRAPLPLFLPTTIYS